MFRFGVRNFLLIIVPFIVLSLFFLTTGFVPFSFAAQTFVCPTPDQKGVSALQLLPCYVVTSSSAPVPSGPYPIVNLPLPSPLPAPQPGSPAQPGAVCQSDSIEVSACTCPSYEEEDQVCVDPNCIADLGNPFFIDSLDNTTGVPSGTNCTFPPGRSVPSGISCVTECNSKPIIYLYPTKTTNVSVKLALQGRVTVSDPLYPVGGWQNVEAHPDGNLVYKGKHYRELYYESETIKVKPLDQGIFIATSALRSGLDTVTEQLGLNTFERGEFLDYWVPRLTDLHAKYILFSVFGSEEKAKVDSVLISPKPDTFIEFLAYFKPVDSIYPIAPLQLPSAPQRKGFTAVEWGGTIDR